jgi:hypothetical protein
VEGTQGDRNHFAISDRSPSARTCIVLCNGVKVNRLTNRGRSWIVTRVPKGVGKNLETMSVNRVRRNGCVALTLLAAGLHVRSREGQFLKDSPEITYWPKCLAKVVRTVIK